MKLIFSKEWKKSKSLCNNIKDLVESYKEDIIDENASYIRVTCDVEYLTLQDKYIIKPNYYLSKDVPSSVYLIGTSFFFRFMNREIYKTISQYFNVKFELKNCNFIKPNGESFKYRRFNKKDFKKLNYETSC
mgnify:CR=1 FL=1